MHDVFATLHTEASEAAALLALAVAEGSLTPTEFGDEMAALLEDAHTRAVVIGRTHAGDTAPEEADDRSFAEGVVDGEAEFLAAFVDDLKSGRYEENAAAVERRARMYVDRTTGTCNEAWTLALPETTHFYWHLQDHESACDVCPSLQLGSPYLAPLPTVPGANATPCLARCRCWLTSSRGAQGFTIPD